MYRTKTQGKSRVGAAMKELILRHWNNEDKWEVSGKKEQRGQCSVSSVLSLAKNHLLSSISPRASCNPFNLVFKPTGTTLVLTVQNPTTNR